LCKKELKIRKKYRGAIGPGFSRLKKSWVLGYGCPTRVKTVRVLDNPACTCVLGSTFLTQFFFAFKIFGLKYYKSIFSILKYECIVDGASRKLIVKNISAADAGNFFCEAIGANSRVGCKLSVGKSSSGGGASGATYVPRDNAKSASFGLQVPANMSAQKIRDFVLNEIRNKDLDTKKKWIRSPDSWNQWIRNPEA